MEFWGKNRPKKRFLAEIFGQIFDFSRKSLKFVNRTTSLSGVQIFREIRILRQKTWKWLFSGDQKLICAISNNRKSKRGRELKFCGYVKDDWGCRIPKNKPNRVNGVVLPNFHVEKLKNRTFQLFSTIEPSLCGYMYPYRVIVLQKLYRPACGARLLSSG